MPKEDFEDGYLEQLAYSHQQKALHGKNAAEKLLIFSGVLLNWVGEWINDKSVSWSLQSLPVDSLTLSGMGPDWNEVVIKRAQKSPAKLRELIQSDPAVSEKVQGAAASELPILVRKEGDRLIVLDGMNRVISAIRDNKKEIDAYIGAREGKAKPEIEPHVIYDFIRAYKEQRGNPEEFKAGLRFLISHFANVQFLLETRFSEEWIHDKEISELIYLSMR